VSDRSHDRQGARGAMGAKSGRKDCRNQRPMSLNIELRCKVIVIVELLYQIARHRKIVLCYMR
jgi:hypothetical protein